MALCHLTLPTRHVPYYNATLNLGSPAVVGEMKLFGMSGEA